MSHPVIDLGICKERGVLGAYNGEKIFQIRQIDPEIICNVSTLVIKMVYSEVLFRK